MSPQVQRKLVRGDVCLISFPFTDATTERDAKNRPAIFVSNPAIANGPDGHFLFVGTTPPGGAEAFIEVEKGTRAASEMGLVFPRDKTISYIRIHKIMTIAVSKIVRRIGTTPSDILTAIDEELSSVLGL